MKTIAALLISFFTVPVMALDCPKTVKVEVRKLTSVLATDASGVEQIYLAGDQQTEQEFIEATLRSANKLTDFDDVLTYRKALSTYDTCGYRGAKSLLSLYPNSFSKKPSAVLRLAYVDYVSKGSGNPTSAKGYQLELVTPLKLMNATAVTSFKTKKSMLEFELDIQIPLGDYGTDGYTERTNVGSAETVVYTVIN